MPGTDFHPDLRRTARWLPRAAVGSRSLKAVRAATGLAGRVGHTGAEVERVGQVGLRVHRPPASVASPSGSAPPSPALLWIHGGGYVIGTAAQDDRLCRQFADELGIVVAAVDYRLAPEHRFPAPLEDCYDALRWLGDRPEVDCSRLAVGGASAGGGLAAALALLARDRGEVSLAFQLLVYPMLDDRTAARTDIDQRHLRMWNNRSNRFGWQAYTGSAPGSPEVGGLASPARAEDLVGLPPAWMGVGTLDLFYGEDLAYAERLKASGVDCQVEVVEGAYHGFDAVQSRAPVSGAFRAKQRQAVGAALHRAG